MTTILSVIIVLMACVIVILWRACRGLLGDLKKSDERRHEAYEKIRDYRDFLRLMVTDLSGLRDLMKGLPQGERRYTMDELLGEEGD